MPDLRPLSTVEILDAAWLLLRRNWVSLYACSGMGTAPVVLLVMVYFRWLGTSGEVFYGVTAGWAVAMALAWSLNSVARSAVTALALRAARDGGIPRAFTLSDAWNAARAKLAGSVFVGLASFAAAWLPSGCLVFPGLMVATAWWVARPIMMDEERPYSAALRRSAAITRGYRMRAFGLWGLFVVLWAAGTLNLVLVVQFLVGTAAGLLGFDASPYFPYVQPRNLTFMTFLLCILFVLLDPLKCAADAVLYLDLRVRREGADLQERLRLLRAGTLILGLALLPSPAGAATVDEYREQVRALRKQLETPGARVAQADLDRLRHTTVELPGGQKIGVRNRWLPETPPPGTRSARELAARLEGLERSLGGVGTAGAAPAGPPVPAPGLDTRKALTEILQAPEFQPLAERPEMDQLLRRINLGKTGSWWTGFRDWLRRLLFRPRRPQVDAPEGRAPDLGVMEPILFGVLGLAALYLLAVLVRSIVERDGTVRANGPAAAPPLEASSTENALDHSADDWERFARQWLDRGEVRQAVRALYLATLVHLHRQRLIDYNRALTNWVYVREFRGQPEQRGVLKELTALFDDLWYGDRPCGPEQYRRFESGARALGTPAPAAAAPEPAGG